MGLLREELVAEGRARAVGLSNDIFQRFGWDASIELLSDYQRELTDRGRTSNEHPTHPTPASLRLAAGGGAPGRA